MSNVIQFPGAAKPGDTNVPSVEVSATPDQMLAFCVSRLIEIQAGIDAMAIALGSDLTSLMSMAQREPIDQDEFIQSYKETRRVGVKTLMEELQRVFPPKSD